MVPFHMKLNHPSCIHGIKFISLPVSKREVTYCCHCCYQVFHHLLLKKAILRLNWHAYRIFKGYIASINGNIRLVSHVIPANRRRAVS